MPTNERRQDGDGVRSRPVVVGEECVPCPADSVARADEQVDERAK